MAVLGVFLILVGLILWVKNLQEKRIERKRKKTEGERMGNRYVLEHERKLFDDKTYDEYLNWCKFHGELPLDKSGFDKFRDNENRFEQKIRKSLR